MTPHETALAAAWRTYSDRYDAYRKLQSGLSLKSWLECHGDKTPAEIAFSEAISSYLAALPTDDLVERLRKLEKHHIAEAQHSKGRSAVTSAYNRAELAGEAATALTPTATEEK